VRTLINENRIWFVAKDVCDILQHSNHKKAVGDMVEDTDVTKGYPIQDSLGRKQYPLMINEFGLYSLILRSNLLQAKQFRRWITHEVIPSIRKTGSYSVNNNQSALPDFTKPAEAARAWAKQYEKAQLAEQEIKK